MIAQARALLDLAEQHQPGGRDAHLWHQRVRVTESWAE
jgi:hypothetical protein